jgi:hypothetical protein
MGAEQVSNPMYAQNEMAIPEDRGGPDAYLNMPGTEVRTRITA